MLIKKRILRLLSLLFVIVLISGEALAVCADQTISPQNDVCWNCIYPIKFGGQTIRGGGGEGSEAPDAANSTYCVCPWFYPPYVRYGIPVSFWEPARYIETVKDPYCFPSVGNRMSYGDDPWLRGNVESQSDGHVINTSFAQAHMFIFNAWAFMELLMDFICVETSGFDLYFITEIDSMWQDDELAYEISPEAGLFGHMSTQLACVADAVASNLSYPLSPLFWCMGSEGSAYPLTGHILNPNITEANAGISHRLIYKLAREMLICDVGVWLCSCVPTPIWVKHNYRYHIMRPVRDFSCHPIGRVGLSWAYGKNPPYAAGPNASDNYVWMIFRKRACCAF